jgi:hypothetical protein
MRAVMKDKIIYDPHRPAEEFHAQLPAQMRWKADNYNNLMEHTKEVFRTIDSRFPRFSPMR